MGKRKSYFKDRDGKVPKLSAFGFKSQALDSDMVDKENDVTVRKANLVLENWLRAGNLADLGSFIMGKWSHKLWWSQLLLKRSLQTTAVCLKNRQSGIPKGTFYKDFPLTYEASQPPYKIAVTKSWNSWHTSNLYGEEGASDAAVEDLLIRKLLTGIWLDKSKGEFVIKRRYNTIYVSLIWNGFGKLNDMYFRIGFSEELLSHFLKRPVILEVQSSLKDDTFKMI